MDKFERFEHWLLENGAQFPKLELRSYDTGKESGTSPSSSSFIRENYHCAEEKKETSKEGDHGECDHTAFHYTTQKYDAPTIRPTEESEMRGVHAKVNILPNTVCVSIPRKCLVTVEMGQATEIGQIVLRSNLDLDAPKHIYLMIFLLWDRKVNADRSFFKPYYDILPQTLSNIPIFWSDEELSWLQGSYMLTQIADRNEAIADDYYAICQVAPGLQKIATLEEFKWARMCVCSRNFGLQIGGHRTSALVPHADMFNHYRPRETKWTYDDTTEAFTITTLQMIPAGAQVYDSYGQKCNHRFLLNYGFAVEDNREVDGFCPNEVPLELTPIRSDLLYRDKCEFWLRGDDDTSSNAFIGHPNAAGVSALTAAFAAAASQHSTPSAIVQSAMEAVVAADVHHGRATRGSRGRSCSGSQDHSLPTSKRIRVCVANNENTKVLFSMLRVLECDENELRSIASHQALSFSDDGCPGYVARALRGLSGSNPAISQHTFYRTCRDIRHPISLRNEQAAMRHLLRTVVGVIELYNCTLAQDVADLADERTYPQFSNIRHAKIQVRGEKEILHHFALWARTALDVMAVIEREIEIEKGEDGDEIIGVAGFESVTRAMEDDEDSVNEIHHTIVRYCTDVLGIIRREELKKVRRSHRHVRGLSDTGDRNLHQF